MATDHRTQIEELAKVIPITPATTIYNFESCLSAPAVQKIASTAADTPVIIPIPSSPYPSPLADNLNPDVVKSLHDHLCGPANGNNTKSRRRGKEVWLSWKRGWDLNNNYYIEGREDPAWIAEEYRKLKKEFEAERAAKRLQQLNQSNFKVPYSPPTTNGPYKRAFGHKALDDRPGRTWKASGFHGRIVKKAGHAISVKPGDVALVRNPSAKSRIVRTLPTGHPTKTYLAGEDVPLVHKNVPKYKTTVEYMTAPKPAQPPQLQSYQDVRNQREVGHSANMGKRESFFKRKNCARKNNQQQPPHEDFKSTIAPPLPEDAVEDTTTGVQEILMTRPTGDLETVSVETDGLSRIPLSYESIQKTRDSERPLGTPSTESGTHKKIRKSIQTWKDTGTQIILSDPYHPDAPTENYPEDVVEVDLTQPGEIRSAEKDYERAPVGTGVDGVEVELLPEWQEVDKPNPNRIMRSHAHSVPALRPSRKNVTFSTSKMRKSVSTQAVTDVGDPSLIYPTTVDSGDDFDITLMGFRGSAPAPVPDSDSDSDSDSGTSRFNRRMPLSSYMDDREAPIPFPVATEVTGPDGASGGFIPMKHLKEYVVPEQDFPPGEEEEWTDPLQNTVWRPRRTGETMLQIGLDRDIEEFSAGTDLEIFGGVDCGRSPYPVLRSVDKYVEFKSPNGDGIVKKKVWDGVTGTVFNMPSMPLEKDHKSEDERLARMKTLYGDKFRDERGQGCKDIFPLDIRRVDRVGTSTIKRKGPTPLLRQGETELQLSWRDPLRYYPDLPDTDPWWVTPEQERLRDVPPRKYPPRDGKAANGNAGDLLYTDDILWKEEVENDSLHHSRYFVTNLHGGTLIVNGVEVRKGCVAGPLPEFAIIECPGDQIAFWFGPGGRFWGEGSPNTYYDAHWNTLRQQEGWEHVALNAGQVWNTLIKDRLRRELTGNRLEDDEAWAYWKNAEPASPLPEPTGKYFPYRTQQIKLTHLLCPMKFPVQQLRIDFDATPTNHIPGNRVDTSEPGFFLTEEDELRWLKTRAKPLETAAAEAVDDSTIRPTPKTFWATDPGDQPPVRPEFQSQWDADADFDAHRVEILDEQRAATKFYFDRLSQEVAEAADKLHQDIANRKRKNNDLFSQPTAKRTKRALAAYQLAAHQKHRADYNQATQDRRIWVEHLARKATRARNQADNPSYTDAQWKRDLEAGLDELQALWHRANLERRNAGLGPLAGNPPKLQARLDKARLKKLLKIDAQNEAGRQQRIEDGKAARAAAKKAEQDRLDKIQQKKDATTAKRAAAEASLTDHEKRVRKRMGTYNAMLPALKVQLKQQKIYQQQAANAARVNRFVNGLYPGPFLVQAVVPPTPLPTTLLPRPRQPPIQPAKPTTSKPLAPAVTTTPPPVSDSASASQTSGSPSSPTTTPPIGTGNIPSVPITTTWGPQVPLTPVTTSRPLRAAGAPFNNDQPFDPRPASLPTPAKTNDQESPPPPIPGPNFNPPPRRPDTPPISKTDTSAASSSSPSTPGSPLAGLRSQSETPSLSGSPARALRSQTPMPPTPPSPAKSTSLPKLKQNSLPASGFNPSDYLTQDQLSALSPQEQLSYVLENGLELIPSAPKCQQHEYLLSMLRDHGDGTMTLDQYLALSWDGKSLTEYLQALRTDVLVIPDEIEDSIKAHPEVDAAMQEYIFGTLRDHYMDVVAKSGMHEDDWARGKLKRDEGRVDATMTFAKLMRYLMERAVADLMKFEVKDRSVTVRHLLSEYMGLRGRIERQHKDYVQGKFAKPNTLGKLRWCNL